MASSKLFHRAKNSNSLSSRTSSSSSSSRSELFFSTIQEAEEEESSGPVAPARMSKFQRQRIRLQDAAQFLPQVQLQANSKRPQDYQDERHSIRRKRVPSPTPPMAPPNRSAPPPPAPVENETIPNDDYTPSERPSVHSVDSYDTEDSRYSLASPTRTPPLRSTSPPAYQQLQPRKPRRDTLLAPQTQPEVQARSVSTPLANPRPTSYHSDAETEAKPGKQRKSWMPGGFRSRNTSQDLEASDPVAWIPVSDTVKIQYNISALLEGKKVEELWNDNADALVYLFPESGPQFRVPSNVFSASRQLVNHVRLDSGRMRGKSFDGRSSLSVDDATRDFAMRGYGTPPPTDSPTAETESSSDYSESIRSIPRRNIQLYFPTNLSSEGPQFTQEDTEKLIRVRNLFAFLTGQPLLATANCRSYYHIFRSLSNLLSDLQFSNPEETNFGEAVETSLSFYIKDLQLQDSRYSVEKTIQAIVIGESLQSESLYVEGFAHAVGKYEELKAAGSPLFADLSKNTQQRLERAYLSLKSKQRVADLRLTNFDFPSIFAGAGASTSSDESKLVRFKFWKSNFLAFRKEFLQYYKDLYGQWPPKASSKKNSLVEGGLNRIVLKHMYRDLSNLYDFLADRHSITTRQVDMNMDNNNDQIVTEASALRKILNEYDNSSPPAQPPIPYDIPLVPTLRSIDATFDNCDPKSQQKALKRKLHENEYKLMLLKSYNADANIRSDFLDMYKAFDIKEGKGKNALELSEQRYGHWIFLYAVIQSLPLLTTDAPGLQHTTGVEYFLCEPPMGGLPWLEEKVAYFKTAAGGVIALPTDVVNYGIEATYRRSHCWMAADQWLAGQEYESPTIPDHNIPELTGNENIPPLDNQRESELGLRDSVRRRHRSASAVSSSHPSSSSLHPDSQPRSKSRNHSRQAQRYSIALGLERLPMPAKDSYGRSRSAQGEGRSRKVDSPGEEKKEQTFDDIFAKMDFGEKKKEKKKGFF